MSPRTTKDSDVPMSYVDIVLDEVKKNTPKKGFNVCVFDDFGRPGDMLTCIGHFNTREEANKVKESHKDDVIYVYGKD